MGALCRTLRAALCVVVCSAASTSLAQSDTQEACPGFVATRTPRVIPAALARGEVSLTFVGHATFLIESPGGVRVATDYNDYVRPAVVPDVATMNRAHSTHYSTRPGSQHQACAAGLEPRRRPGAPRPHVGDARVRNVSTNIRDLWGGGGTQYDMNSMFVVETAELCIAHLGHLHHTLEPSHLKKLGRIDVVLVPVDGGYTLDTDGMMEVLKAIGAPLILPMHYFNPATLDRFLAKAKEHYRVEFSKTSRIVVSRATLPPSAKVLVLPESRGGLLGDP